MDFRTLLESKRKIINTDHAVDRLYDDLRFGKDIKTKFGDIGNFKKAVEKVVRSAMDIIVQRRKDKMGKYAVHSKGTGIGAIIDWGPYSNDNRNNHARIVTLLPIKQVHRFQPGDVKLTVEQQLKMLLPESVEISSESDTYDRYDLNESHSLHFWEGDIYDNEIMDYLLTN